MSIQGIKDYFNVVTNPAEADFYYCGQISDGTLKDINITNFKYLKGNEHKHIVTIEGDWVNESMPEELYGCIFTGNGMKDWQKAYLYCSRPCMSKLLIHLVKNNVVYNITYPNIKSFGFRGVMDSRRTRARIYQLVVDSNIPHQIEFTQGWLGSADVAANNTIQQYARIMKDNIVSLCPRGEGEDTIRFYESCFLVEYQ